MYPTPIYLDHSATTPVSPTVIEAMLPYWTQTYGNAASSHTHGRNAQLGLEKARRTIAEILGARYPNEIIFTGCGSESDNLALRGVMCAARQAGQGNHLITSCIEHEAVLATAVQLRDTFGFDLTIIGVDQYGRVNPDEIQAAIRPDTALISIMAANNEIGTLQPLQEIGQIARQNNILFHTDAVQAATSITWQLQNMPIDLLSLSPHKFYGPKGVGILYLRDGLTLMPSQTGGGQENGRRAGTTNVPLAVGAATALQEAHQNHNAHQQHCQTLRDTLIEGILSAFSSGECQLTGHPTQRLPHHASFAFQNLTGSDILMHLDMANICGSSGSACSAGNPKPSHILKAIGLDETWARGGLRLTVGQQNTTEEIEYVINSIPTAIQNLRAFTTAYT